MELIHIDSLGYLPHLSDGFTLPLRNSEWAALFPRHHLMWVSPDFDRAKEFVHAVRRGTTEYSHLLSEEMKQSFDTFYSDPLEYHIGHTPCVKGQTLDSTVCFLPTNDCTLGCNYCFSGAQPKKFGAIPWDIAKAAVDLGVRNAV